MQTKIKVILEGNLAMLSREASKALGHKESYLIKHAYADWINRTLAEGMKLYEESKTETVVEAEAQVEEVSNEQPSE